MNEEGMKGKASIFAQIQMDFYLHSSGFVIVTFLMNVGDLETIGQIDKLKLSRHQF
jgi:hypothetical protein